MILDRHYERTVLAIDEPIPMVLVVGPAAKTVVLLPAPSTTHVTEATLALQGTSATLRCYRWPLMVREAMRELGLDEMTKPEDAWDNGLTFHLDRCHKDHRNHVSSLRGPSRRINQALRSATH